MGTTNSNWRSEFLGDTLPTMATFNERKSPTRPNTAGRTSSKAANKLQSAVKANQPKLVVKKSAGRYQVLAPALVPKHVSPEQLEAAVLSLAR